MADAIHFEIGTGAASRYLTACNKGRTAFTDHSERFNRRATHIHCCPREPREVHQTSGLWFPPANRVRSATASGFMSRLFMKGIGRPVQPICGLAWRADEGRMGLGE